MDCDEIGLDKNATSLASALIYTHHLNIHARVIDVKDKILILSDSLGNVRFFDFENF